MTPSRPSKPSPPGGELSGLLRKAEELQKELDRAEVDLREATVEGADASDRVSLRFNGEGLPVAVRIDLPGLEERDRRALEEALTIALRSGMERLFALRKQRLSAVTRGLNLPNLFH